MFFCFKQKTAYELRISDWSSDVCSSDLPKLPKALSYEESRELAHNGSDRARADLAVRIDLRPEVLYFLAEDPSTEVRRRIAANAKTPRHADLLLARAADEAVPAELAAKIPKLTALEGRGAQEKAQRVVGERTGRGRGGEGVGHKVT